MKNTKFKPYLIALILCLVMISSTSCSSVVATTVSASIYENSGTGKDAAMLPSVIAKPQYYVPGGPSQSTSVRSPSPQIWVRKAAQHVQTLQFKPPDPRITYRTQPGDSLSSLAARFGVTPDQIYSGQVLPASGFLPAGQVVKITDALSDIETTPTLQLLPDGEVIFSPTASDFDVQAFAEQGGGYLTTYSEFVPNFGDAEGWEVIDYLSTSFSINPRLLYSLLEYNSNWVFGWPETELMEEYPLGVIDLSLPDLHPQITFAAKQISEAYYGWRAGTFTELTFTDGTTMRLAPSLNAGTVGLMHFFSKIYTQEQWLEAIAPESGFAAFHAGLFGDPWQRTAESDPIFSAGLVQPELILPFEENVLWFYSSGPHQAWSDKGALAAVDLTPATGNLFRCVTSEAYAVAAAAGEIVRLSSGLMLIDLDGDGNEQTGWVLMYLHLDWSDIEGVYVGAEVAQGQVIGRPSCLRGRSTDVHIHFARKYNGEWMNAGGAIPMEMSGWVVQNGSLPYEGTMVRNDEVLTACTCGWQQAHLIRTNTVAAAP